MCRMTAVRMNIPGRRTAARGHVLMLYCWLAALCCGAVGCSDEPLNPPPIVAAAPDTTSHEFVWDVQYFGDGDSYLNDIVTLGDTIWVLGRFHLRKPDGTLDRETRYNCVRWDGTTWTYQKIESATSHTQIDVADINCGAPLDDGRVMFCTGGGIAWWNGKRYYPDYDFVNVFDDEHGFRAVGNSKNRLVFVGWGGRILLYENETYRYLASGTTQDFIDVWSAGDTTMCFVSGGLSSDVPSRIYRVVGDRVDLLPDTTINKHMTSVWCDANGRIVVAGDGVYRNTTNWRVRESWISGYKNTMSAKSWYDIFVAGHYGSIQHYNGRSWREYKDFFTPTGTNKFTCSTYDGRDVYIGGNRLGQCIFVHGRKIGP